MRATQQTGGFSLIEVLCAILILGVALVALTQGITTALGSNKESERQTAAALIAAGRMETLRARGGLEDGVEEGECGPVLPLYQWKETIRSTAINGLHEVDVQVNDSHSGTLIYDLKTLLFEPPETSWETTRTNRLNRSGRARGRERSRP